MTQPLWFASVIYTVKAKKNKETLFKVKKNLEIITGWIADSHKHISKNGKWMCVIFPLNLRNLWGKWRKKTRAWWLFMQQPLSTSQRKILHLQFCFLISCHTGEKYEVNKGTEVITRLNSQTKDVKSSLAVAFLSRSCLGELARTCHAVQKVLKSNIPWSR